MLRRRELLPDVRRRLEDVGVLFDQRLRDCPWPRDDVASCFRTSGGALRTSGYFLINASETAVRPRSDDASFFRTSSGALRTSGCSLINSVATAVRPSSTSRASSGHPRAR